LDTRYRFHNSAWGSGYALHLRCAVHHRGYPEVKNRESRAAFNPVPNNTAAIASTAESEAGGLLGPDGIRLGFDQKTGRVYRFNGEGNLLLCAGPRTGKLTTVLAPAISRRGLNRHSLVIIDPKGEIACITKTLRQSLGPVYVPEPV